VNIKKILVPTDFSANADKGIDYACTMAKTFGAAVIVLHVSAPPFYQAGYGISPETITEMQQNIEQAIEEQLEKVRERLSGSAAEVTVRTTEGIAAVEIVETAKREGVDLIIMATHGHTGVKHFFLGSTTEKVVRTAACPVLTVRSDSH